MAAAFLLLVFIGAFAYKNDKNEPKIADEQNSNEDLSDEDLKSRLLIYEVNLSSCAAFSSGLLAEIGRYSDKYSACQVDVSSLKINLSVSAERHEQALRDAQERIAEKDKELKNARDEIESEKIALTQQYRLLAQNSANNICCKSKVDMPRIRFYKIEGNKITCIEEGTMAISC